MRRRLLSAMLALVMMLGTMTGVAYGADPRVVPVADAAELIAAIRDLQPGDTIVLEPGTYDVGRSFADLSFGGQPNWYFPIWQDGVTIRGAGSAETTLTSSVYSANGVWASQDFISIWANGVTIEDVTIASKRDTNKAIEVMGKDFTLRNTVLATNPDGPWQGYDYDRFSGSIYYSPQASVTGVAGDVGASLLENVYLDGAWIAAPVASVTAGIITLTDVTLDWIDAAYSAYGYGMMSSNAAFVVDGEVLFIVDDTMSDLALQATSRMPAGATLIYRGSVDPDGVIPAAAFTALKDGGDAYPAEGVLEWSFESTETPGFFPYAWTFAIGTLDPAYNADFSPAVAVRTTVDTAIAEMHAAADLPDNGLAAAELDFAHSGALPGPAQVKIFLDEQLAGLTFDLVKYAESEMSGTELGAPVSRVTVDDSGYVTIGIDTGDVWYLVEYLEHTVTFVDWDGSVIDVQTVEHMTGATAPADPVRDGYTFVGWDTDFSEVTADITVTALYASDAVEFVRHAGADRYETAATAALADFPKGAEVAILAYARNFPDALAASALAGVAGAPILLTDTAVLNPLTADALETLGVKTVYIVGGEQVVSGAIETGLAKKYEVKRLGGPDRYATARLIADEAVARGAVSDKAFLVYGGTFADALSVSSIAAQRGIPVLLTRTASLDAGAAAFIDGNGVDDVYIAGGPLVVSGDVKDAVEAFGTRALRWSGNDRYETAAAVADGAKSAFSLVYANVGLASGTNFPDALAGGAAMGRQSGLLMITAPAALSVPTEALIVANKAEIAKVEFFGGTVALSQKVEDRVRGLLQ